MCYLHISPILSLKGDTYMKHVVIRYDKIPGKGEIKLLEGFSDNLHIAEKYRDFREEISEKYDKNHSVNFDIVSLSDQRFQELQMKFSDFGCCPEINELTKGIYISDDDYYYMDSIVAETMTELSHNIESTIRALKMFDDEDAKELIKKLKKFNKRIDNDNGGEDLYASIDWERMCRKILT